MLELKFIHELKFLDKI